MTGQPLTTSACVPCEGGTKPLTPEQYRHYLPQIPDWQVLVEKSLVKTYTCTNFSQALALVNAVGVLAEAEGHHPDIYLHNWKRVTLTLSTHAIGGLSLNDFILAAKISALPTAR